MKKNEYGNHFGYHNPALVEPMFKKLNKEVKGARFVDGSWHNDLADSAVNMKRDIHIFFPNSEVSIPTEDKFVTFTVYINQLVFFNTEKEIIKSFNTIEEVIEFVQEYVNNFDKR